MDPYNLSSVAGLNFSYLMMEKQNTIEMRLVYGDGTAFGVSWSNLKTNSWQSQKTLYTDLKCLSPRNKCNLERKFNTSRVRSIEFIISNNPDAGDRAGQDTILLDEVQGLMAIPTGSAWARAEKEREIAAARELAAQSEMALRDPSKNAEGLALAVESLSHSFTSEGAIRVRSGLEQIPRPIARIELNSSMFCNGAFGPDGTMYAIYSENTSLIYDLETGKMLHHFNHSDHICSVAFSPIERLFASASDYYSGRRLGPAEIWDKDSGKETKIWDIDSGKEIRPPWAHEDVLCFSPDGKLLATASNKTIRIWDVHGHKKPLILNHDDPVNDALFSPNGEIIATTEYNYTEDGGIEIVNIWSIQSGLKITHIKVQRSVVRDWSFSHNGTMFAVASYYDVRIYDALNWSMIERLDHDDVNFIAFSADGGMLATFSDDLRVWKIPTYKELLHFGQHGMDKWKLIYHGSIVLSAGLCSHGSNNLAFNPDGRTLAILDSDTVCILDIQTGQKLAYFPGKHKIIDFAFSPDGKMLTTISNECAVTWDLDQMGQEFKKINVTGYFDIAFDDNNRTKIAVDSFNDDTYSSTNLYMWEMETWQELWHKNMNYSAKLFFNINGSILMLACSDNMTFLDVQTGDENYKINLGGYTPSLKISADETKLAVIGYIKVNDDSNILTGITRVLDIDARKELFHLATNDLIDLIFTPDSKKIILARRNNPLIIYDSKTGNELKRLNYSRINDISLSSGGKILATAGEDCTAKIWDINTGNELATVDPMIHNSLVLSVVFGPSEEIIATTCLGDNFVRIWNIDTGEELMKMPHPDYVKSIIFSKDGASIATTCHDETVRVWDVQSGDLLHSFHNYPTEKVIFSRNGEFLATLGGDDVLRIWPISSKSLICQACSRLKCNLTSQEWQDQYCGNCSDDEYL